MYPNSQTNSLQGLRICVLIGQVETIRIEGEKIVVRYADVPVRRFYTNRKTQLVEDFCNWSSEPEEILRFTRMYGTFDTIGDATAFVTHPHSQRRDVPFELTVSDWRGMQKDFQSKWEFHAQLPNRGVTGWMTPISGGAIVYQNGRIEFQVEDLQTFLNLDLFTIPMERLRKCARPGCETPYFVARHLRQLYCSEQCALWGKSQSKQNWWSKHGKEWLAQRKRKKSRKAKPRKRR